MALDGIFLYSIKEELKNKLINGRIDKINQPENDEIILNVRSDNKDYKLLISASPTYPRIHLTKESKSNPMKAPMFCMVLRKYISSGRIVEIKQLQTDRIIFIHINALDEMGYEAMYILVIEIMGRHSNITLVRGKDNVILDSIKHVTLEMNTIRTLLPGISFVFPPESLKLNPLDFNSEEFDKYINENDIKTDGKFFSSIFTGVSNPLSKEMYFRFESYEEKNLYSFSKKFFKSITEGDFIFASYSMAKVVKDFHCVEYKSFSNFVKKVYTSPSELMEDFYFQKDKSDRLNSKSSDLQKITNSNMDRCEKKIQILKNTIEDSKDKEKYRIWGELLTSNIYNLNKGEDCAKVLNYYESEEKYEEIPLKLEWTPSQNIQNYYKKYNKMKKSEVAALIQLELAEKELNYLNSVLVSIKNADNYEVINEIKKELMEEGYIKFKSSIKKEKQKTTKPIHYSVDNKYHIYVGRNNYQNDSLTLKFAEKRDIWFHTKNIPGSHVILKYEEVLPNFVLELAANLAAYYSKGRDSSKVPVDYTSIKNIKKPNGAKPGMVIYFTNKTIYADPKKPEELNIKREE